MTGTKISTVSSYGVAITGGDLQVTGSIYASSNGTVNNKLIIGGLSIQGGASSALTLELGSPSGLGGVGRTYGQIAFSYLGTATYQHFIASQHYGGQAALNKIVFHTCDGTQANSPFSGTVFGMEIENGSIRIGGSFSYSTSPAATLDVQGNAKILTGFGCNGTTPQTAYASGGALSAYAAGGNGYSTGGQASALYALVVAIRAALVANGIMS